MTEKCGGGDDEREEAMAVEKVRVKVKKTKMFFVVSYNKANPMKVLNFVSISNCFQNVTGFLSVK